MSIYLPIAEVSVSIWMLLAMGLGVGLLTGMFGVGGGFLMTPILIFIGVPSAVAVGSLSCQVLATSIVSLDPHLRTRKIDEKMAIVLTISGVCGSLLGVLFLSFMRSFGQLDLVISLAYVLLLGGLGSFMFYESMVALMTIHFPGRFLKQRSHHIKHSFRSLPWRMRFVRSKVYISVLGPILVGFCVGFLASFMGIGGGILLVPAMIYLLGMTNTVVGTSLMNITLVAIFTAFFQAVVNQSVDIVLSLILILGAVAGAYFGGRFGRFLRGEEMRSLLAIIVLLVAMIIVYDLVVAPESLYEVVTI